MENNLAKTWGSIILLFMLLGVSSCNKDGDETISLEYGSIKKMIIGKWKIDDITHHGTKKSNFVFPNWINGTILTFFEDGTYMDSSDGGRRTHRWQLEPNSNTDSPYYGDIRLDNYDFDISSMGTHQWVLGYPDDADEDGNPEWEIDLYKEDDEQSETEEEPEKTTKLIKTITRTDSYNDYDNIDIWDFKYDDKGRIIESCWKWSYPRSNYRVNTYSYNSDNEFYLDSYGYHGILESTKLMTLDRGTDVCQFSYDENGFLTGLWSDTYHFTYKDNNLYSEDTKHRSKYYYYSKDLNDANLDLNPFIIEGVVGIDKSIFDTRYVLEPFGFYGRRSENLVKGYSYIESNVNHNYQLTDYIVKRDTHGNIIDISFSSMNSGTKSIINIEYYD